MDPRIPAAARALSAFDPLAALREIALCDDAPALALRGVALAQLGDFAAARKLLARAARAFGTSAPAARARCLAAEAEIMLACRDLAAAGRALETAAQALEAVADAPNALFVRIQLVRRLVFLGNLTEAERELAALDLRNAQARMVAMAELVATDIAMRTLQPEAAHAGLRRARIAARAAKIPALNAEIELVARNLDAPVARVSSDAQDRSVTLDEVAALIRSGDLIVDACRKEIRAGSLVVPLGSRPVLLALAVALGQAAPNEAAREALIQHAFESKRVSESLRARLRVEIGRLRRALADLAVIRATARGFSLTPRVGAHVHVLLPPSLGHAHALWALLEAGQSWSTSALAAATGSSQRAVQRALGELSAARRVQAVGEGRARRWVAPRANGFATTLLLVARPKLV